MTLPKPEYPERFGQQHRAFAEVSMLRRRLHAEPAHPVEYGLRFEYAEVLPQPAGLAPGLLWIADAGRFERPFVVNGLVARAVNHLRDLEPGLRLWMHLYPEPAQTGVAADPINAVMTPWVCIDTERNDYAIWKSTGALYESDPWEGVAEDPIWAPPEMGMRTVRRVGHGFGHGTTTELE